MAALVLLVVADKTGTAMFFFKHRVVVGIFVLMALMGYLNLKTTVRQETMADKISTEYRCSMVCKVDDIRESGYGYQVYVTGTQAGEHNVKVKIILYMNEVVDVRMGLQLISEGKFTRPEEATNPGTFDARSYYAHKGIYLICKDPVIVGRGEKYSVIKDFLYRFRLKAGCVLDRYFDEQDASVMRGMLLGEKSGIDKDTKRLFQVNGIAHILAISGVKTQNLAIPLTRKTRINSAFVPLHIAKIYILKLCLDEEIIPRCRFPCSRGYLTKCINWQKKQSFSVSQSYRKS